MPRNTKAGRLLKKRARKLVAEMRHKILATQILSMTPLKTPRPLVFKLPVKVMIMGSTKFCARLRNLHKKHNAELLRKCNRLHKAQTQALDGLRSSAQDVRNAVDQAINNGIASSLPTPVGSPHEEGLEAPELPD